MTHGVPFIVMAGLLGVLIMPSIAPAQGQQQGRGHDGVPAQAWYIHAGSITSSQV